MSFEPIIAFFILRYINKNLKQSDPQHPWIRLLTGSMIGVVILFLVQQGFNFYHVDFAGITINCIWHIILLLIVWGRFNLKEFAKSKCIMVAVLLLAIFSWLTLVMIFFGYVFFI